MTPAGFEPAIPVSESPQTHILDYAATGIGNPNVTEGKQQNSHKDIPPLDSSSIVSQGAYDPGCTCSKYRGPCRWAIWCVQISNVTY
jgi:hypothetical protein